MTRGLIRRDPGELPAEVTGFVGRQRELAVLDGLLGTARLVTVTGPGGVGKTRVALRAAARSRGQFADGVCLAELGGLHDPDLLPHTVATCLGLPGQDTGSQTDAIVDYLRGRRLLLILDSCEHLIGACAALAQSVLRYAAQVTILATSRQPMNVPGEHCCPVPPLPVPEPGPSRSSTGRSGRGDAVELFAQRAAAASPGFTVTPANRRDVIRLCGCLDGIPLAIELAAVQLRTLTLPQLNSRLEHRFELLTTGRRGALPHQQTLRATTRWSYDLCSPDEQLLWARLSVFAGSFDLAAAEAVCAGGPLAREDILPTLIGLVDKSVVLRTEEDAGRYWLLDTIREFGAERLAERDGADADRTMDRHIGYFRAMAGEFGRHAKNDDQLRRYHLLRREHPDLRAALGYALDRPGRAGEAARLAADLRAYWEISGLLREGKLWLTRILLRFPWPSPERAWLLLTRGVLGTLQGELGEAVADLELSTPMADEHGEVLACALGHAYLCLAFVFSGRHAEAAATGAVALERLQAIDYFSGLVSLDIHMGYLHLLSGDLDAAIERCDQGLRRLGDSQERWARGYLQIITALALFFQGKDAESAAAACASLERKHELGDIVGAAYCLEALAMLAQRQQRSERTAWLMGAADALWERAGQRLGGTAIMEELHQQAVKAAQEALGEDRYAALFRDGAGRPLDLVVSLAVADADELPATPGRQRPAGLLTGREGQIAALVGEGMSNRDIAQHLGISKRTVDAHLEHIFGKLGISSRVQLATGLSPAPPSPERPPPPPGPPGP
jgi:predicted ATPase/DNA-binding CsgD family transcriptional regulator